MSSSFVFIALRVLIAVLLFKHSSSFSIKGHHMRSSFKSMVDSKYNVNPNNEKREVFGGSDYFNGMITEPIAPTTTTKIDGKERDNLTPNIKFIGIWGGVIFGLFELFMLSNKDITPPPY